MTWRYKVQTRLDGLYDVVDTQKSFAIHEAGFEDLADALRCAMRANNGGLKDAD